MPIRRALLATAAALLPCLAPPAHAQDDAASLARLADALVAGDSAVAALRGAARSGGDHQLALRIAQVPDCRVDARRAVVCSAAMEPEAQARARHSALASAVEAALRERGWRPAAPYAGRGFVETRTFTRAGSNARISVRLASRPQGYRVWLFADQARS